LPPLPVSSTCLEILATFVSLVTSHWHHRQHFLPTSSLNSTRQQPGRWNYRTGTRWPRRLPTCPLSSTAASVTSPLPPCPPPILPLQDTGEKKRRHLPVYIAQPGWPQILYLPTRRSFTQHLRSPATSVVRSSNWGDQHWLLMPMDIFTPTLFQQHQRL